jgi:RNA polymerase sigma factor (sigma-70 family)
MTERELAQQCMAGRRNAQYALYKQYSRLMMTVCLRYTNNKNEAEDVMQEGFVKVFSKLDQWENKGPLGGWIRSIMVNTALSHYRKHRKVSYTEDVDQLTNVDNAEAGVVSAMSAAELLVLIGSMPPGYKMVFNLFAIEGYGHKEIADMLEISENTSKTQFLKARAWLQKALNEH